MLNNTLEQQFKNARQQHVINTVTEWLSNDPMFQLLNMLSPNEKAREKALTNTIRLMINNNDLDEVYEHAYAELYNEKTLDK